MKPLKITNLKSTACKILLCKTKKYYIKTINETKGILASGVLSSFY